MRVSAMAVSPRIPPVVRLATPASQTHSPCRFSKEAGFATADLRSKSWDEFILPEAPVIDVVITVCGAAEETCPVFPGHPATAHWGFEDPSAGDATDVVKLAAFRTTLLQISQRIELLVSLPDAALQRLVLEQTVRNLAAH